jgi:DUF1009 family protein
MNLAVLAGDGDLPVSLLKNLLDAKSTIIIDLVPNRGIDLGIYSHKCYHFTIGEVVKILEALKKNDVDRCVFAGKISKEVIFDRIDRGSSSKPNFDPFAIGLLESFKDKRDDTIMLSIINFLESNNFMVEKQSKFLQALFAKKKVYTHRVPTEKEMEDIKYGFFIAKELGRLDIGQTVVIKDRSVMAVESIEGTDRAIERGGTLGRNDTAVVKVAKVNQDERFDIPTVGLSTLKTMLKVNSFILAVEAGKTFILDEENMVDFANKNNMTIIAV